MTNIEHRIPLAAGNVQRRTAIRLQRVIFIKKNGAERLRSSTFNARCWMFDVHLLILFLIAVLLCIFSSTTWAKDGLKVVVSIGPQKYFVEKIGGDGVDVSVMVLPGSNPATYEPKPQQMVALTKAQIYFAIGVPFEQVWLKKFASVNPEMDIVHTEDGIKKVPMEVSNHHGKNISHHGEHHGTTDPHVWLSPSLVMIQARNIRDALGRVDPVHKDIYQTNYKAFQKELADTDRKIKELFSDKRSRKKFMVYHPSWGYFARAYGLEQIAVEIEGKAPKGRELQQLIQYAVEEDVKVVFVQPQFSKKSAKTIAKAIGCQVMVADPLAMNWTENLLIVAEGFRSVLK